MPRQGFLARNQGAHLILTWGRHPPKHRALAWTSRFFGAFRCAQMAELVDALVSGTSAARRGGSSPLLGTKFTRENPRKSWKNFEFESTADSYAHRDRAICDFTETLVAFRSGSIASRILAASGG